MLVVNGRKTKPDPKNILMKALKRALKNLNTQHGPRGIAGLKKASKEIPEILRKNDPSVENTLGEWAFFTFRLSEQNRKDIAKFLTHAADDLNLEKLKDAANPIIEASEYYGNLRRIFRETLESGIQPSQIADDVEGLLARAYEKERQCVELIKAALLT